MRLRNLPDARAAPDASPEEAEARFYLRVTLAVAAGMLAGALLEWVPAEPSPWRWLPLGLAYLIGGQRIARDTWRSLRHGRLSIDFLMGAAALGAAALGAPLEGAVLIFLFSLSNALETYALGRTRRAIGALLDLRPEEATLVDEVGREVGRVRSDELRPGQRILVRPGERIAADGEVIRGRSRVDQSAITGESVPVSREPGEEVFAGTIAQEGALTVQVTRPPEETMLARIIQLVEEAREQRAPAQHFIDRFAHPYTVAVVAGTLLAALLPPVLLGTAWSDAAYRAITLLVVASPCALVISTPSAILSGIANGARHGLLFKGGAYLDLAGTIDAVAFDKTGTLTIGEPRLVEIVSLEGLRAELTGSEDGGRPKTAEDDDRFRESSVLRFAAAVERESEHHMARAVLAEARERGLEPDRAEEFTAVPGQGVSGRVDGARVWVGNAAMAARHGATVAGPFRGWTAEQTSLGRSVVYVGRDGRVDGALSFGDRLRPTAVATVRHLRYEGIRWIVVLSGDHPDAVRAIAAELGADEVRAGLLPHEKVDAIRSLAASSRGVAMVGDGVNDAPAMAAASLGVAMGAAGTDVAIETADVVLMGEDVEKVDYVIHLGKRTRRIVRQNVWFSVGWMGLLVLTAATVGIPLPLAVIAHEGSTLLVVANGLRLLASRPHPPVVPSEGGPRRRAGTSVPVPRSGAGSASA